MDRSYSGALTPSSTDFNEVRDGRRSSLFHYDLDLGVARSQSDGTHFVLPAAGNSFYVDKNPALVGSATVHFQDTTFGNAPAPVFCEPGFIATVPFTQLFFENEAQPDKIFRFMYGVDIDFQPGTSATVAITGNVRVIDDSQVITLGNRSFVGLATALGDLLDETYAYAALWNPSESQESLVINQYRVSLSESDFYVASFYAGSIDGVGDWPSGTTNPTTSKLSPGINGPGVVQGTSRGGNYLNALLDQGSAVQGVTATVIPSHPIILTPGQTFLIRPTRTGNDIAVVFDFVSIPL